MRRAGVGRTALPEFETRLHPLANPLAVRGRCTAQQIILPQVDDELASGPAADFVFQRSFRRRGGGEAVELHGVHPPSPAKGLELHPE
jgi:hypothetical protein